MSHDSNRDLSRIYRAGANEEPPAWLDASIRAAAAEACSGPQAGERLGFVARWRVPLAAAAIVTAGASTLLLMQLGSPDEEKSVATAMLKHKAEGYEGRETSTDHQLQPSMAGSAPGVPAIVAEGRAKFSAPEADRPIQRSEPMLSEKQAAAGEPAAELMEQRARRADQASDKLAAAPLSPKAETSSAPAPATSDMRPPAEDFLAQGNAVRSTELDNRIRRKEDTRVRGGPPAADSSGITVDDASRWLRDIEKLFADGREREARESLEQFRKRYPAHPIPDKFLK